EVKRGRFRRDLFYRLDVFTIELPPLRARGRDVLTLAHHFAGRRAEQLGWPHAPELDRALADSLLRHPFEGNVRELRNMVERAMTQPKPLKSLTLRLFPGLAGAKAAEPASTKERGAAATAARDPQLAQIRE